MRLPTPIHNVVQLARMITGAEMLVTADGRLIEKSKVGWYVINPKGRIVNWGPPTAIAAEGKSTQ